MPDPQNEKISETSAAAPARHRGGRQSRQAQRDKALPIIAGVRRQIPTYELLTEEGLCRIEAAIDTLLQEVGIDFRGDPRALELWREAGADVDGERVRFAPGLVRGIIAKTAPKSFVHHARNPARSVKIGGEDLVFSPAYGSPFVHDLEGGRRYGSLEDFRNFIKLAYMSPWLHHSGGTVCEPVDIPVNKRHLDMVYSHIKYSDKPFMGGVTAEERAEDSIALARIAFGAEFTDGNCVIMGNINANSPLVYDGTMTRALRAYARANQCTVVVPFILGGAMGPVTNAGAIAQSMAEAMVGVALTQLERPGAPAILGNFLSSTSLRSGSPTFGTPEPALGSLVIGQLTRRLGIPLRCSGAFTASKAADGQAMQESAVSMMAALQCGAHFILHSAGWLEGGLTMSYEKFIMDADFCGAMHTYLGGLPVDDNALALDAFREVGPGKHFFGCEHTLRNYQTAYWDSEVADNNSFEQWRDAGEKDATQRANAKWRAMLRAYQPPAIDPAVDEALQDFIARKKQAASDMWH
ncbi:MAG TPA: trimethylamine methyltransferase family protein [Dongiaceae bacterium]